MGTVVSSAVQIPDPLPELLVGGMRVDRRRQRRDVAGKPLGEVEVPRSPVYVGHRAVTQPMKGIQQVEPGLHLPRPESHLDPAW